MTPGLQRCGEMTTAAETREYLSLPEVALKLGISAPTVRRKIAEGELPAVRLGGPGSSLRVSRSSLERWLASRATAPETAA